jgi:hypothetical protein
MPGSERRSEMRAPGPAVRGFGTSYKATPGRPEGRERHGLPCLSPPAGAITPMRARSTCELLVPKPVHTRMISKLKSGGYRLYSRKRNPKTGKRRNLGTFASRQAAEKHERAVQYFKRR